MNPKMEIQQFSVKFYSTDYSKPHLIPPDLKSLIVNHPKKKRRQSDDNPLAILRNLSYFKGVKHFYSNCNFCCNHYKNQQLAPVAQ